ncbi:MAG: ABC transporter permease [Dehalococcoidia bacterium]|nr:ABC transporter permease [Dehalococcoidia bacterium]
MKRALIVALRELKTYLGDKGDLAFSLLLPIATFALIYGAFGGPGLFHGTAFIVNEDTGVYGKQLVENIAAQKSLDVELLARADAETKLERSDLRLVLLIPAGFSDRLRGNQPVQLTFLQRGNGGQEGQIVASIIRGVVSELNQEFQVRGQVEAALAGKGVPQDKITLTVWQFVEREREHPLVGVKEIAAGSKPNMVNQFLPGIITMYVLFSVSISASVIVDERRKGTLERLLTTRLTIGELFLGKFLASVFRGYVQTLILLALAYAVFQIFTPSSFIESLAVALVFAMAASALGLVIAAIARTQDAATWIDVFVTMFMTMLGGTFFEIGGGTILYSLSKLSLNTYANDSFKNLISEGGSITSLGLELAVMGGVIIAGIAVSRFLFKALPQGK